MEHLLEVHWDDPIAHAVAQILGSVPEGVEQATGEVPCGQGSAFVVYRSGKREILDGLARALSALGARVRVIPVADSAVNRGKEGRHMAKDPICGMEVEEKKAAATATYEGRTYFFCAPGCKTTFVKAPEKYAAAEKGEGRGSR